ncbi:MAG: hypothetical protein K0Q59_1864 [Paenibacillus sp.]|nr:hypothetical protein [Paenibacillus sp.]
MECTSYLRTYKIDESHTGMNYSHTLDKLKHICFADLNMYFMIENV